MSRDSRATVPPFHVEVLEGPEADRYVIYATAHEDLMRTVKDLIAAPAGRMRELAVERAQALVDEIDTKLHAIEDAAIEAWRLSGPSVG